MNIHRKDGSVLATDYREWLLESLKDPKEAAAYLEAAWEDGDNGVLCAAMKDVTEANGGVSRLAKRLGFSRSGLYKIFSGQGNPELGSLVKILAALKLKISIQPAGSSPRRSIKKRAV